MDTAGLSALTGIIISLLFEYFPRLSVWFAEQEAGRKRLIMAGVALVVSLVIFVLGCTGRVTAVSCDESGAWHLAEIYFAMLVGNQTIHSLAKRPTPNQ